MGSLTLEFWITTAAIIVGPLAAVLITGWLDRQRGQRERRVAIFRTLMKTRRSWGSLDHVEALNLIEVDFHNRSAVFDAYRNLFDYFVNDIAKRTDEDNAQYFDRKAKHHASLLTKLLKSMADDLGYKKDALEILQGGYSPIVHGEIETDQMKIRKLLAGLHDGTMVLPTAVVDYRHAERILAEAKITQLLIDKAGQAECKDNKNNAEETK